MLHVGTVSPGRRIVVNPHTGLAMTISSGLRGLRLADRQTEGSKIFELNAKQLYRI